MAGAGNGAGFAVRVTAATNQRRITNPSRKFAAGASGGGRGSQLAARITGDCANRAVLVIMFEVECSLVTSLPAAKPCGTLAIDD